MKEAEEHQKRCRQERKKYVEAEQKKPRKRSKSTNDLLLPCWKREHVDWDELALDLMQAFLRGSKPFTDDILFPGPVENDLIPKNSSRW